MDHNHVPTNGHQFVADGQYLSNLTNFQFQLADSPQLALFNSQGYADLPQQSNQLPADYQYPGNPGSQAMELPSRYQTRKFQIYSAIDLCVNE